MGSQYIPPPSPTSMIPSHIAKSETMQAMAVASSSYLSLGPEPGASRNHVAESDWIVGRALAKGWQVQQSQGPSQQSLNTAAASCVHPASGSYFSHFFMQSIQLAYTCIILHYVLHYVAFHSKGLGNQYMFESEHLTYIISSCFFQFSRWHCGSSR